MAELWTRASLEGLVGASESLTLEFKSYRALLATGGKDRKARILEAARDVAGMANEQGGTIIYGIAESGERGWRTAKGVESGFERAHKVNREWFLQLMRDHIHPPLEGLDAVDVPLDDEHIALVILVPQARGVARQTDELLFPRRDAQGLHNMTVQEIEDVRARQTRPVLALEASDLNVTNVTSASGQAWTLRLRFAVTNVAETTAEFAVVTVGFGAGIAAMLLSDPLWQRLEITDTWKVFRSVLASGSSPLWSPLTPGLSIPLQELTATFPSRETDLDRRRVLGLARLDHTGGRRLYRIDYQQWAQPGARVCLNAEEADQLPADLLQGAPLPRVLGGPGSAGGVRGGSVLTAQVQEREAIDAAFAGMADDADYRAESVRLAEEFAAADAEALRLGEAR